MKLAFDWDGTLVDHAMKPRYDDPAHVKAVTQPHPWALARARGLIESGAELHIVTGRGPLVREVTLNQVRLFLAVEFPTERLHMQPVWTTYAALRSWKATILRAIEPAMYVGDHACDLGAASDAGVPFMEAEAFRAGHPMPARFRPHEETPLLGVV